jgi:tetratricopeptide (TPR) repeat protein
VSLIVARQAGPHIVRVGDTHLTDPLGSERASALQGIIKIRILSDTLCVSFAGSLYWAEVGFAELENLGAVTIEAVTDILVKVHQDSSRSTDFLVTTTMPSLELLQVKDGQVRPVSVSWIGSEAAFKRFQEYATGALAAHPQLENTVSLSAFRIPEATSGESNELYGQLMNAVRLVIEDSSLPEVGGFTVPVRSHKGKFEYMDYATVLTHPIQFDLMPSEFVVPFGTAEEGGYAFNLMSDRVSSMKGLAVYALQGRYGVAFVPRGGLLRPLPFRDVSPLEFEEAAAARLDLSVGCMYTQPEEHGSRAINFLNGGDSNRALEEAERAVARSNKIAAGFHCRGIVLATRGELALAIADVSEALTLDPANPAIWDNRGLALAKLGRLNEAHADFSEAIRVAPKYVRGYRHRAMVARNLGDLNQAHADEEFVRILLDGDSGTA